MPIRWSPSLAVGDPEIDAQHQELFRRAERLMVALRAGDRSEVDSLVSYLSDYVVEHFGAEEALMRTSGYPDAEAHRAAHEGFRADLAELASQLGQKGGAALVALSLHNWLSSWLRRHIAGADLDLARHLRQPGAELR